MISPLAQLACKRDALDEEIQRLCSQLGALTQERFVVASAIKTLVVEEDIIYTPQRLLHAYHSETL